MINVMDLEFKLMIIKMFMKVNGNMIKKMDLDNLRSETMVVKLKSILLMVTCMELVINIQIQAKLNFNFAMEN